MKLKTSGKRSKKLVIALVAVVLVISGAAAAYLYLKSNNQTPDPTDTINYAPATEEEKQAAEDLKRDQIENSESDKSQNSTDTKKSVTPFITAWGQASAGSDFKLNGFVPQVIETDGKCTLTLSKDDKKVTKTRVALADAKNTTCGQTVVPFNELEPGEWKAVLKYDSPHSSGSSEVTTVEVK